MKSIEYDILIIGSGPAGLTAAIYAIRAGKKVGLITGPLIGGQLANTSYVENYPGFIEPILGSDLMNAMYNQVLNLGVTIIQHTAISCKVIDNIFLIKTDVGSFHAKSVIVATGSNSKMLGIEGSLLGKGISTCATCDGNFFKNKQIAVVGGGNSAFEEALYLSAIASKVFLVHRRKEFRADKIMQQRVFNHEKIEIISPYIITEFVGEQNLERIKIMNCETKKEEEKLIDAVFIAIGHIPNTFFLKNLINLDEEGYAINGPCTEIKGLFVAGDVFDKHYRQAITAAGYGCIAAIEAIKYLNVYSLRERVF